MTPTDVTNKDGCVQERCKREQQRPQLKALFFSFKAVLFFFFFFSSHNYINKFSSRLKVDVTKLLEGSINKPEGIVGIWQEFLLK